MPRCEMQIKVKDEYRRCRRRTPGPLWRFCRQHGKGIEQAKQEIRKAMGLIGSQEALRRGKQ